jgi:hypothetical protein
MLSSHTIQAMRDAIPAGKGSEYPEIADVAGIETSG